MADAKTYLTGSYPLGLDSNVKIARTLNAYQRQGLTPDYVEKRNALIQAVTLAAGQRDGEEMVRSLQARDRHRRHARTRSRRAQRKAKQRRKVDLDDQSLRHHHASEVPQLRADRHRADLPDDDGDVTGAHTAGFRQEGAPRDLPPLLAHVSDRKPKLDDPAVTGSTLISQKTDRFGIRPRKCGPS